MIIIKMICFKLFFSFTQLFFYLTFLIWFDFKFIALQKSLYFGFEGPKDILFKSCKDYFALDMILFW